MKLSNRVRRQLIGMVQEEFNRAYPFLKIEFGNTDHELLPSLDGRSFHTEENIREGARSILEKDIRLSDNMKVSELETSLQQLFGSAVQVYRKSGNFWMETKTTRHWTLKQHNDHGQDIAFGF